jgi:hypothetical protein
VADKSLAVEFKNPWNLLADFNSDLSNTHARQREKLPKSNWRCDLCVLPRLHIQAFQLFACVQLRQIKSTTKCSWLFAVKGLLFVFIRMWFPGQEKILKTRAINAACKGKNTKMKYMSNYFDVKICMLVSGSA